MKLFLFICAMMAVTLVAAASTAMAGRPAPAYVPARARFQPPAHVGHAGPYCVYYVGKNGHSSPYRYHYSDWRYPQYYGGTHARVLQNVGISPADIGIRGSAW